jgi:hypothetical protein
MIQVRVNHISTYYLPVAIIGMRHGLLLTTLVDSSYFHFIHEKTEEQSIKNFDQDHTAPVLWVIPVLW